MKNNRSGFTLLEVILALTILAGAMAVLGEINRQALQNAAAARDLSRALTLAESKLAEIKAGITSSDSVENQAFDTTTESLDQGGPAWLYSISSQATNEPGLILVRVTVTRDQPAAQHPVKFSLVRLAAGPQLHLFAAHPWHRELLRVGRIIACGTTVWNVGQPQ